MLRSGVLQALAALWAGAAWAQLVISESPSATERPFAVGVDSTGRAQARSNAAGQVMIESPEYPRGLWLHVADEAGQALAGIQVDYHGLPNGLVALHCVDPAGLRRETLLWTLPQGDPLRLTLQPRGPADLPCGSTWPTSRGCPRNPTPERPDSRPSWPLLPHWARRCWW